MKNYQSPKPPSPFHMIDKRADKELGADAYYLYVKLIDLAPNEDNSNAALMAKTGFSKRRFDRAKKELVEKGYLDTKQLYANHYAFYIGKEAVRDYKKRLKKGDNRYEQNEIRKMAHDKVDGIKA